MLGNITSDVLICIVSRWLHLKEVVSFDSSIRKSEKLVWLSTLRSQGCIVNVDEFENPADCGGSLHSSFMQWLYLKECKASNVGWVDAEKMSDFTRKLLCNNQVISLSIKSLSENFIADNEHAPQEVLVLRDAFRCSSLCDLNLRYHTEFEIDSETLSSIIHAYLKSNLNFIKLDYTMDLFQLHADKSKKCLELTSFDAVEEIADILDIHGESLHDFKIIVKVVGQSRIRFEFLPSQRQEMLQIAAFFDAQLERFPDINSTTVVPLALSLMPQLSPIVTRVKLFDTDYDESEVEPLFVYSYDQSPGKRTVEIDQEEGTDGYIPFFTKLSNTFASISSKCGPNSSEFFDAVVRTQGSILLELDLQITFPHCIDRAFVEALPLLTHLEIASASITDDALGGSRWQETLEVFHTFISPNTAVTQQLLQFKKLRSIVFCDWGDVDAVRYLEELLRKVDEVATRYLRKDRVEGNKVHLEWPQSHGQLLSYMRDAALVGALSGYEVAVDGYPPLEGDKMLERSLIHHFKRMPNLTEVNVTAENKSFIFSLLNALPNLKRFAFDARLRYDHSDRELAMDWMYVELSCLQSYAEAVISLVIQGNNESGDGKAVWCDRKGITITPRLYFPHLTKLTVLAHDFEYEQLSPVLCCYDMQHLSVTLLSASDISGFVDLFQNITTLEVTVDILDNERQERDYLAVCARLWLPQLKMIKFNGKRCI